MKMGLMRCETNVPQGYPEINCSGSVSFVVYGKRQPHKCKGTKEEEDSIAEERASGAELFGFEEDLGKALKLKCGRVLKRLFPLKEWRLTGLTHICDKNCNQRILYDNHSSLCRASGQIFPLTPAEEQAVRGVRRKLDAENSSSDGCGFKRRRDTQFHTSPFERSFSAVSPICSQVGDGMDMS
ncbi:hypothetical protein AHAS_Ahas20G0217400 [Arachis hypogaea]